jgi:uncharacterized protein (DUF885 family)
MMTRSFGLAGLLLVSASSASLPVHAAPVRPATQSSADARLRALYDGYSTWDAAESAVFENSRGEIEAADHLPKVDLASQQRRAAHLQELLAKLNAIPEAQLSPGERVNAAVFRTLLENAISDAHFRLWEMPFNSDSSFWTYLDSDRLDDAAEYRRYIARMRDIPRYFDEQMVNLRAGLTRGFSIPRATLEGRDASIAAFLADDMAKSPFHKPFDTMPATIPAAERQALRAQGEAAIRDAVQPAYRKLLDFFRTEYLPKTRTTISAHDLPDGDAYYRATIREFTTLDIQPEEIHQIGLKQVAQIEAQMRQTMRDSGFKGSFEEFLKFLKTDSQFQAKTPDELMGVSAYVAKRTDNVIGNYFGLLPRRRFGIVPVPDALAPFYTGGRGGLENCMMNTYNLSTRPLYNIPALTLHECEPGHSFQAALSIEQKALPRFRQNLYFSGYGEGWGLYCEWLGNEMGIYRTPYERFGQQSYAMWRAARLVIDTGLHRYGWSRQQAVDYLAGHTALSQHEVETEVDRYISWPGQADSYMLGLLTIRKLRSEAETKLGPKFDIRGFHDTFLGMGAVPLNVLEQQMRTWMAAEAAKPAKR